MRPRLAHAFTIVPDADVVWLVAGEDVRFALRGEGLASWLPRLLRACDGRHTLAAVLLLAPAERRAEARALIEGLVGERVVIDAGALAAHVAQPVAWTVDGNGRLADGLRAASAAGRAAVVRVYAQDTLELAPMLAANRAHRADGTRWLWTSIGPQARALIGPLLLPDAGPCAECLVDHFRLRSPVPELYDRIAAFAGPFTPASFDEPALACVVALVQWKLSLMAREPAAAALYQLHAVEVATLEVSAHRVLVNPECPACATRGT